VTKPSPFELASRAISAALLTLLLSLILSVAPVAAQTSGAAAAADAGDDVEAPLNLPGLLAKYSVGETVRVERFEPAPALALAARQAPDLRLPATGWKARWAGLLDVQQSGEYHFSAITSGALVIRVNGKIVLEMPGPAKAVKAGGRPDIGCKLDVGYHPLAIEFAPDGPGATLEINWKSDTLALERIPGIAYLHSPQAQHATGASGVDNFFSGRLAVEEHSCLACHQAADDSPLAPVLSQRKGPKLHEVGSRLGAGWIYHWLGDPQAWRAGTVMPRMFSGDRQGEVERYAVATVLAALKGQNSPDEKPPAAAASPAGDAEVAAGKKLYERVGCMACHEEVIQAGEQSPLALHHLGKKLSVEHLAAYLADPGANDPHARMPALSLTAEECRALAVYLSSRDADDAPAFDLPAAPTIDEVSAALEKVPGAGPAAAATDAQPSLDEQIADLGRRVLSTRRCTNCHDLPPSLSSTPVTGAADRLPAVPAKKSLAEIVAGPEGGCLAENDAHGAVPRFGTSLDRAAVRTFLREAGNAPGTPDPGQQSRLAIARFRCQVCHDRDGQGGLSADLYAHLTANQTEGEAELVRPPSLTGVARKLRTTALTGVLVRDERSRPWMALRMPRFPKKEMEALVTQLTSADASTSDAPTTDSPTPPATVEAAAPPGDTSLAEAGRTLIGSRGFGCIKCHDVRGIPSGGTRGPDLARITRRVRHDWFDHWMTDPQRLEPGTRMPTVFLAGTSPYAEVLDGEPTRQRDAMWAYLSAGDELALPEGIESPSVATSAGPMSAGRPWVLRTFLPEVSPRSMAIRFGGDVYAAFDAQNCRLAYVWQGDFVDLAASWTHRGGREAGLLGKVIWRSPAGFPWAISLDKTPVAPDFAAQAADIALGGPVPPHDPQPNTRLHFLGYRLPPRGAKTIAGPTMRYEVELADGGRAIFAETISPLVTDDAVGLLREIEIKAPAGATAFLNCAADAKSRELSTTSPPGSTLQVPFLTLRDDEGPLVLSVRAAPAAASWLAPPGQPGVVLALPCDPVDGVARLTLAILRAKDASPEGLKRLVEQESSERRGPQ